MIRFLRCGGRTPRRCAQVSLGCRQAIVPLRRGMLPLAVLAFWGLTAPVRAQGTGFQACLPSDGATCSQLGGGGTIFAQCPTDPPSENVFRRYFGPVAWYPIRCVGPITVAVETYSTYNTRFPLYVEVVPLRDSSDFPWVCENLPGRVILIIYGQSGISAPCGTWDEAGPIDITPIVPVGSIYALRLYFFWNPSGASPAVGCIRVTAQPAGTSPVASTAWGNVKALYR